ncbi:MAG: hypothetical protein AW10_03412 [Candidatus Accumulibacter appositus]|uniref:Uncharacterized protein n=1 Tax=Candidatus Accumulibacter appositus TaxID=1454003 RepID=A0A011PM56_9PROT|nr:hypothetical protein [Accumulibacter sp.]EXI77925.1 MAG: hypothetical protein AW10_03412 [Candidatus Accumulibacter appositus]HRF03746.1 hypothetical protein [Accumulibacter sp.]
MKRLTFLAALSFLAGPAAATPESAADASAASSLAAIGDLGQLNGQALACGEMAIASEAKKLAIRHAPKTRRYGESFEEETNAAFLAQGQMGHAPCPTASTFSGRLNELSERLQTLLPAAAQ